MQQVQMGQLDRFAILVGRYQSPLFKYAQSKLRSRSLAEDAVQETFLAVYRSRQSFDPSRSFAAWLWTIHGNTCRRLGKGLADAETSCLPDSELSVPSVTVANVELAEDRQRLLTVLDQLPAPQADAIRLRFFGELGFEEIGQALGCGTPTAKSRVRYGLTKMAALLTQRTPSNSP